MTGVAAVNRVRALGLLLLALFQIGKPQLGNRDVIGLKTSANELALHTESGKINLRWLVTD